jgi:hypothetical protein
MGRARRRGQRTKASRTEGRPRALAVLASRRDGGSRARADKIFNILNLRSSSVDVMERRSSKVIYINATLRYRVAITFLHDGHLPIMELLPRAADSLNPAYWASSIYPISF